MNYKQGNKYASKVDIKCFNTPMKTHINDQITDKHISYKEQTKFSLKKKDIVSMFGIFQLLIADGSMASMSIKTKKYILHVLNLL